MIKWNPHLHTPGNKTTNTVELTFKKPIHWSGATTVGYEIDYDDNMNAASMAANHLTGILQANTPQHLKKFKSAVITNTRTGDRCRVKGKYHRAMGGSFSYQFK